ncbi:glycosyltransferase family 4 protein [Mariniblastus fucicola]|uniref:Glycosyl transferases group 1 n=1 Tax=Mariniblastus fucicola TaxID=980251 RepID=A0A5B9P6F9_9BACT|nr:glycosyltransferase family 4 protein [Mariniblastus fucicola]QEG20582.1 Glycosyl transferases group 1 [Mariniblastus fucicola]
MTPSTPQRIAIVTRRFWPISGPTEHFIADLGDHFSGAGNHVRLFTSAWQKGWPTECSFREFDLRRLSRPSSGPWGTYRYQRALIRELDLFQPDAVLLFGSGEDLPPVRKLVGDSVPCVVRIDHRAVVRTNRTIQKNLRLNLADAVICDSLRTRNELVMRKTALPQRVELVSDGVTCRAEPERSLLQQANSRTALGDAHPILRIDPAQPLVVTGAPLNGDGGVCDLVRAWKIVLESFPKAKLWILGDGPRSRKVWDTISDHDMIYTAIMPGYFDDLDEIFQAADLYVHPMRGAVNCRCLLEAIANGVCPLVTDNSTESIAKRDPDGRRIGEMIEVQRDSTGIIAPPGNPVALGEAITMALRNSDKRLELGANAATQFRPAIDMARIGSVFLESLLGVRQPENASGASFS